nr:hypothetical protein CFP56_12123 [Quercus suber]
MAILLKYRFWTDQGYTTCGLLVELLETTFEATSLSHAIYDLPLADSSSLRPVANRSTGDPMAGRSTKTPISSHPLLADGPSV